MPLFFQHISLDGQSHCIFPGGSFLSISFPVKAGVFLFEFFHGVWGNHYTV